MSDIAPIRPGAGQTLVGPAPVSPVRPVGPITPQEPDPSPLGRSGLDLRDVLTGADQLLPREKAATVTVANALESARSALVRGAGTEALAALDRAWEGARHTESGWYLRSGALAVLGLPGEAEAVLLEAVDGRPRSVALGYLLAVVRSTLGDGAGARQALTDALGRRPGDPLLLALQVVLTARQGDLAGADRLLSQLAARHAEHAGVDWARQARQSLTFGASRTGGAGAFGMHGAVAHVHIEPEGAPVSAAAPPDPSDDASPLAQLRQQLHGLGRLLASPSPAKDVESTVRAMQRALSAGGLWDGAIAPSTAHAARTLLASTLVALQTTPDTAGRVAGRGTPVGAAAGTAAVTGGVASAIPDRLLPILHLLRAGRPDEAEASLRQWATRGTRAVVPLLAALIGGASPPLWGLNDASDDVFGAAPRVFGGSPDPVHQPVRLGLALLEEGSPALEARNATPALGALVSTRTTQSATDAWGVPVLGHALANGHSLLGTPNGVDAVIGADGITASWVGLAMANVPGAGLIGQPRRDVRTSLRVARHARRLRAFALTCIAFAFSAAAMGKPTLAIALAGGAAWLAFRSATGAARRPEATRPD